MSDRDMLETFRRQNEKEYQMFGRGFFVPTQMTQMLNNPKEKFKTCSI